MRVENTILLKLHELGGVTERRNIMRSLLRFKSKEKDQAFDNLESEGLISIDEIVRSGPGPYSKRVTMTEKGRVWFEQLVAEGLVIL